MSRKIKSLLIAGLLVLGNYGGSFAMGVDEFNSSTEHNEACALPEGTIECGQTWTSEENPWSGKFLPIPDGNNGVVAKLEFSEDGKYVDVIPTTLQDLNGKDYHPYKIEAVHVYYEGSNKMVDAPFKCYDFSETENGGKQLSAPLDENKKLQDIQQIIVYYTKIDYSKDTPKDDEPVLPDVPKDPIDIPLTGDTIMWGTLIVVGVSLAGIVYVSRKDDDEE